MTPILLYITGLLWFIVLAQNALLPFWAGDWVFVLLFIWFLYFTSLRQDRKRGINNFWIPFVLGLGTASFVFYSFLVVAPYFISLILFSLLLYQKSQWVFRYKEGFTAYAAIFSCYAASLIFLRVWVFDYILTLDFLIRLAMTFIVGLIVWGYAATRMGRGRIR